MDRGDAEMNTNMKVIAHRGGAGLGGVENTMDAFVNAINLGVDMVEFDVRRTKDNALIVIHDSEIDGRKLSDMTFDEIQEVAGKKGYAVPTFVEVIKLCHGKVFMDIEIKETGYEKRVVNILHKYLDYDEYSVKSFYDVTPYRIKMLDSRITVGLLLGRDDADFRMRYNEIFPMRRLKACKADFVCPYPLLMLFSFTRRMNHYGYPVYVWTVNNGFIMKYFIKFTKVAGLITDRPDRLKHALLSHKRSTNICRRV